MACRHCHVEAGPDRSEIMCSENIDRIVNILACHGIPTLDITGGAPELHPDFTRLVAAAVNLDCHVIVRCNLTVLLEPGMDHMFEFYADYPVEIVASFPYYREADLDRMRGAGSFAKSILVMRRLNEMGYGMPESGRIMNLVYNPGGAFLPALQCSLEAEFRSALAKDGISFNRLLSLVNMPIGRFRDFLIRTNNYDAYVKRLADAFNPDTLAGVMCRQIVSVAWDGRLFDCDFNQMLDMPIGPPYPGRLEDFDYVTLSQRKIIVGDHCFGCTAGQGSSCGGALD
jgi:radical SAM/Cys-rich protein